MELQEFIAQSLKQINNGIREGSQHIRNEGGEGVSNGYFKIDFDVAVTTNSEETSGLGGKITIASIFQVGEKVEQSAGATNYSRITFSIPVHIKTDN